MSKMDAALLKKLQTKFQGMDGVSLDSAPPRYWFSSGSAALNKTISGNYRHAIPQGRITSVSGPSSAGKSFISTNCMREAQAEDAFVFVIDSENALDDDFVSKLGVDPVNNYMYTSVATIPQVTQIVSEFLKGYKSEYGTSADAPKVLIVIDSLDMLMTETEQDNYNKGDQKGDQGQRAKQLKAMLRTFVQDIKDLNVSMIVTNQVYQATQQQILAGEGVWVINQAVRYAVSQIILCTRLKLKDKDTKQVTGIRMKVEAFKTRFTKPFGSVTLEVPYEAGMDKYTGIMEILEGNGLLERRGSWYNLVDSEIKFQSKTFGEVAESILDELDRREAQGIASLELKVVEDTDDE